MLRAVFCTEIPSPASSAALGHRGTPQPPARSLTHGLGVRGCSPCSAVPPFPVPDADAPAGEGSQQNKVEQDAYPGSFGAGQGGDQEQRGGERRPALAFPLALGPRGPLVAGHQRTPWILRWKRDGELCPSLAPGCLLGAVVFLPTIVLGSVQGTITSFFSPCFRGSVVVRFPSGPMHDWRLPALRNSVAD